MQVELCKRDAFTKRQIAGGDNITSGEDVSRTNSDFGEAGGGIDVRQSFPTKLHFDKKDMPKRGLWVNV